MQFWFQKSDKEAGTAYVGAEHKGVFGFAALHSDTRELAHAVGAVSMAAMLRGLTKRMRATERRQKEAEQCLKQTQAPHKDPRRSTGINLNVPRYSYRRKKR